jgi:hypothetical protein
MHSTHRLALLTALAGLAAPAAAQVPMTPRALGMAGAYVASARGHEALHLNPANLALTGAPRWSIAFPQLGLGGAFLGPTFGDVPDLVNLDDLEQSRKDEILRSIPESGTELRVDGRAPLFALQNGRVALGVSAGMVGEHTLGRDLVELFFNGYEEGRTDYSVGNTVGTRATYLDFSAGYGHRVGPLSLGATAHYIHGRALARSRLFEPRFDLAAQDFEVEYVGVRAEGGRGYALDVGAALQPVRGVTLSAAVANAAAKMTWNEDLRVRSVTLRKRDFQVADGDAALAWRGRYELSDRPLEAGKARVQEYETARGLYQEAYFPTTLRLGAAWAPTGGTELGAAYQGTLTPGRLGGWWDRSVSVGVQQKLPLMRLRAGYASNLEEGRLVSGGISLGPLELGVGRLQEGARSGWIATFGVGARAPR